MVLYLHSFLASVIDRGYCWISRPIRFISEDKTPGTNLRESWFVTSVDLDVL